MTDEQLRAFLGPYYPDPDEPRCPQCGMTEASVFVCSDEWHAALHRKDGA